MIDRNPSAFAGIDVTRRDILALGGVALAAAPLHAAVRGDRVLSLWVGTYTGEGGGGLYPLSYDVGRDRWTVGAPDPLTQNASFGAYGRRHDLLYLVDETSAGTVVAYRRRDRARVGVVSAAGADPCHVAIDARQRRLAVANYGSGSVAVFALDPATGLPVAPPVVRVNKGAGPNVARQRGPHAHWVGFSPDGRWLHSVDLGTDEVLGYDLRGGVGPTMTSYRAAPGAGPRHMVFHPHLAKAYLLSELAGDVTLLEGDGGGGFRARQTLTTARPGFSGVNYPAELAIDRAGRRLYVSNRGDDSIAVFAVDRDGRLNLMQHIGTQGHWPRFFLLVEAAGRLFVANERSGTVQAFAVAGDGRLRALGAPAVVPGAAFIAG